MTSDGSAGHPAFEVRRLGAGDVALLQALNALFAEVFEDRETYASRPPGPAYLSTLLGDPCFVAVAALEEERAIGGLVAYGLRKFEQARSELYIYDLAVAAQRRRQGVATALIAALQPIARGLAPG